MKRLLNSMLLRKKWFIGLLISTVISVWGTFTFADGDVGMKWNPNSESDLAGYKVYWGKESRNYNNKVDVGNNTFVEIKNLTEGDTYYFAATAYDIAGNESDYSIEISYVVPNLAPNEPQGFTFTITVTIIPNPD